jgi:hypothetical protein
MSERWPGGLINKTAPTFPYSGVWTLDQVAYLQSQGIWPYGPSDPYFYDVSLLLNGDGTNGAQNNTFLDSSTNNFTITRNGNTTQGSFSPYGNLWSLGGCTGSSDYLQMGSNAGLQLGTGDFTVECWAYFTTVGTNSGGENIIMDVRPTTTSGAYFNIGLNNQTVFWDNGTLFITTPTVSLNTWLHIAYVRNSGYLSIYINGSRVTTPTSDSTNYTCGSTNRIANLSYFSAGNRKFNGNISNLRIVKGTAVYTGTSFTVPTAPLTAISGTSLLTLQSNRWIDNSSNAIPISVNGLPQVLRFSPFNPTAPYSTTTIGGSGYFDGSGDYLTTAQSSSNAIGTSDFCIEYWLYQLNTNESTPFGQWASGNADWILQYRTSPNQFRFYYNSSNELSGSFTMIPNQWTHVVVCRSGSTMSLYVNGIRLATQTDSTSINNGRGLTIGVNPDGPIQQVNGYIDDCRLVVGSSVYTPSSSTITVPTAPLTAVSGTKFLANMTNAGIPDLAMQNNLETVGSAQVSTSVKKYGTGSISFNGSNSQLSYGSPAFGGGDFTVECWVNFNSTSGDQTVFGINFNANANSLSAVRVDISSGVFRFMGSTDGTNFYFFQATSTSPSTSTWYHIALVRSSGTVTFYVNGTSAGSVSSVPNTLYAGTGGSRIGSIVYSSSNYLNGYVDDFRITTGLARYTSNFTPPTAALPTY